MSVEPTCDEGEVTVLISYTVPYDSWISISGGRSGHPPGSTQTEPEPPPGSPSSTAREKAPTPGKTQRDIAIVFPSLRRGVNLTGPQLLEYLDASTRASLVKLVWEHEFVHKSSGVLLHGDKKEMV